MSGAAGPRSILYDARSVCQGMSGEGRYSLNLLMALAAQPDRPALRALFLPEAAQQAHREPALEGVTILSVDADPDRHPMSDVWLDRAVPKLVESGELFHGPDYLIPAGRQPFARVATVHDLFAFTHPDCYRWGVRFWLRRAINRASRWADRLIVPSDDVARQMVLSGRASEDRVTSIHLAPDATPSGWDAASSPAGAALVRSLGSEESPVRIITVGSFDPRKDPATAMVAHERLARSRWTRGLGSIEWLWLGGEGPATAQIPNALRTSVESSGFRRTGHVPREAVRTALRSSTVYVTCSRAEGFGIPLVEAMAEGCPIVATDLAIHRELCGEAAFYFEPGDAAGLARQLERVLESPDVRRGLGAAARQQAEAFSWSAAARRTLEVYREAESFFSSRNIHA